jgi:diaminopimelate epimerase
VNLTEYNAPVQANFIKMSGAGNDFVVADNRQGGFPVDAASIAHICDRRFGVGADGVLLVEPSPSADFFMRYYNADGSEAEMCGNGARCIARFYVEQCRAGTTASRGVRFETRAGLMHAIVNGDHVRLQMTEPRDVRLRQTIKLAGNTREYHFANTGVPHVVLFTDDVTRETVAALGAEVRYHADFAPRGTNVNWVQRLAGNAIRVRTYERGVEAETLACGTGVTASAILAHLVHGLTPPVRVTVQSGRVLEVDFARAGDAVRDVFLTGPAEFVFAGRLM